MAFSNVQKQSIPRHKEKGCIWCGWHQSFLDGVHIIDEIDRPSVNGVWMCKNCHAVFEDVFRTLLFRALVAYKPEIESLLPKSWRKGNKMTAPGCDEGAVGE